MCYFSAGSYEDWRDDWQALHAGVSSSTWASLLGAPLDGWPGEWWLNIHNASAAAIIQTNIMAPRLALAASRGCDGVDPDNVDEYSNANGVGVTATDQLAYNRWLATTAHGHGLAVGLKNDLDQVSSLVSAFDFAVVEQCVVYDECGLTAPFIAAGKAVFEIEYVGSPTQVRRYLCAVMLVCVESASDSSNRPSRV